MILFDINVILFNIVIEKNFKEIDGCIINGDENQLKQVFINIIKNGIEVMLKGGVVIILIVKIVFYVVISVKDEGNGMLQEKFKQIGKFFYLIKEKGIGFGFVICLRILKEYDGELKIESEVGKGSVF